MLLFFSITPISGVALLSAGVYSHRHRHGHRQQGGGQVKAIKGLAGVGRPHFRGRPLQPGRPGHRRPTPPRAGAPSGPLAPSKRDLDSENPQDLDEALQLLGDLPTLQLAELGPVGAIQLGQPGLGEPSLQADVTHGHANVTGPIHSEGLGHSGSLALGCRLFQALFPIGRMSRYFDEREGPTRQPAPVQLQSGHPSPRSPAPSPAGSFPADRRRSTGAGRKEGCPSRPRDGIDLAGP